MIPGRAWHGSIARGLNEPRIRSPDSIRITRANLESMLRKSRANVKRLISPIAPANSTPVGPAADDHERQVILPQIEVAGPFGLFERQEDAATNLRGLLQVLEARGELLPFVVAEVRVLAPQARISESYSNVPKSATTRFRSEMDGRHFSLQDANIRVLREDAADRSGNLRGTESGRRHLVQQGLKQMMVPPVDERHLDLRRGAKLFGRVQPSESAPDDDDPVHGVECTRMERPWYTGQNTSS